MLKLSLKGKLFINQNMPHSSEVNKKQTNKQTNNNNKYVKLNI